MLARPGPALRLLRSSQRTSPSLRTTPCRARWYSSTETEVCSPLSYDLHEPSAQAARNSDNKRPIIVIHGLFGKKGNNRTISKLLADRLGRPIYAIDLRNSGQSPHMKVHTYNAMASDVAHFIDEHKLGPSTLLGHSMGAKTAMTLALSQPSYVHDLIAVDNAPVDRPIGSEFETYVRAMLAVDRAAPKTLTEADRILAEHIPDLTIRRFLAGNLWKVDGKQKFRVPLDTLGGALGHLGDFPYKEPSKTRYTGRSLFVRGTKSTYVPDEVLPAIGDFFPCFEVRDIEAGHWVISEAPEEFADAVVGFLENKD